MSTALRPILILLPGMDGTGTLFTPLLQALEPGWPVQVVHYPVDQPLDYPALVERVMQALPTDRPFVLLGESFSGPVAVAVAARCSNGLLGLILCSSFVCNPRPGWARLHPLLGFLALQRLPFWPMDALLLGGFSTPALRSALAAAIAQVDEEVLHARLRAVISVDVRHALANTQVPLLYLRAGRDRLVPRSSGQQVLQWREDAQVLDIDAPHCLLQAAPVEAAAHLLQFMRRLMSRPAPDH